MKKILFAILSVFSFTFACANIPETERGAIWLTYSIPKTAYETEIRGIQLNCFDEKEPCQLDMSELLTLQYTITNYAWSPVGDRLAFIGNDKDDPDGELFVVDASGLNLRKLTDNDEAEDTLVWAPDGIRLAYTQCGEGDCVLTVYDLDLDTRQAIEVVTKGLLSGPRVYDWHFGEKNLLYFIGSDTNGLWQIYSFSFDALKTIQLTNNFWDSFSPTVSPKGDGVIFIKSASIGTGTEEVIENDLFLLNLSTNELQQITFDSNRELFPKWSPTGGWVAYLSGPLYENKLSLSLINPTTGDKLTISDGSIPITYIGWLVQSSDDN